MTGAFIYLCLGFPLVRRHFLKHSYPKGDMAVISNTGEDPALVVVVTTYEKQSQFTGQLPLACWDSSVCLQGTVDGAQTAFCIFLGGEILRNSDYLLFLRSSLFVTFTSTFSSSSNKPRIFSAGNRTLEYRLGIVRSVLSLSPTSFWYL